MLRQVTDLFLSEADRLNEEQIGVFDDVLVQLIERIETRTLVEISERLAPVANAPIDLTLNLARHSEIGIARPILTNSSRLTTAELVEIAKTKSQGHLLAISERAQIETPVTDVLLDRGNQAVVHSVAGNSGAKFSENGFAALLKAAETDEKLAEKTGSRLDLPLDLLRQLLLRATEAVRSRLLSRTPPEFQEQMRRALSVAAEAVDQESRKPRDFRGAAAFVELLRKKGELDESKLFKFARARKYEETAVALSLLSSASLEIIKPLMKSPRDDGRATGAHLRGAARWRLKGPDSRNVRAGRGAAAPATRQAVHRRAAVPEHVRRSGAGILCRWHRRRHHHCVEPGEVVLRHSPQFQLHLQGQGRRY